MVKRRSASVASPGFGGASASAPAVSQSAIKVPARCTIAALSRRVMQDDFVPFACLTCYDATTARWLARGGVEVLLVGDTASEMTLGFDRTIDIPLDVLLALTAGVRRGVESALASVRGTHPLPMVMGDMPFMSYHTSDDDAVRNAARFLVEGQADIVKLEADESFAPVIAKMVRAGIPVCAHVGSRPQRVALSGGYRSAGRTRKDQARVVRDARALQDAGASMLLVEAVPDETTRKLLKATSVPVIGIGAGPACHGQVLVLQDLLGLSDRPPTFAQPAADVGKVLIAAARSWRERVAARSVGPSPYSMRG